MSDAKTVIDVFTAVGTVTVAIMAIWGERVRAWLAPPKLRIELHTPSGSPTRLTIPGTLTPGGGIRSMYYHLKVVNQRSWLTANNCRVLLKAISRRGPDGSFLKVHMPVPAQFVWANEGDTTSRVSVTKESILDFGSLSEGATAFMPLLHVYANNLNAAVAKNEAVRYHLEIDASNFVSPRHQTFEVAWDGGWSFEPEQMQHHLTVREIKEL